MSREAGIPLQVGLTQGGTDGTQFTFWGAPNQGLSWPGRYSHSPGEVLDLRDLEHLGELIAAMARTGGVEGTGDSAPPTTCGPKEPGCSGVVLPEFTLRASHSAIGPNSGAHNSP